MFNINFKFIFFLPLPVCFLCCYLVLNVSASAVPSSFSCRCLIDVTAVLSSYMCHLSLYLVWDVSLILMVLRPLLISILESTPCCSSDLVLIILQVGSFRLLLILTPSWTCLLRGSRKDLWGSYTHSCFSPSWAVSSCLNKGFSSCMSLCPLACSTGLLHSVRLVSPWYKDTMLSLLHFLHLMVYPAPPWVVFKHCLFFPLPLSHKGQPCFL